MEVSHGEGSVASKVKQGLGIGKRTDAQKEKGFDEHKAQLEQRVSVIEQGLIRTGVRVAQLGTEEVVDLFYQLFNPGETEKTVQTT